MTILIIKTPTGEAPLEIRQAWVGLKLQSDGLAPAATTNPIGILTRKPIEDSQDVWLVPQHEAIETLEKHNPQAAKWWKDHDYPRPWDFTFQKDEAVPLPNQQNAWG